MRENKIVGYTHKPVSQCPAISILYPLLVSNFQSVETSVQYPAVGVLYPAVVSNIQSVESSVQYPAVGVLYPVISILYVESSA